MSDAVDTELNTALALALRTREIVENRLGQDIRLLDVRDVTPMTDYTLIVTGTSTPHLRAIFEDIQVQLKKEGLFAYRKSHEQGSGWLVLDYVDVVIHIFSQEMRDYYSLESLWEDAPLVA